MKKYKLFPIILNLFDGNPNTNVTTDNTTGNNLSAEMKTYYSTYLIRLAEPLLVHDQFGQKHPIPKNGGKTIEFRKWDPLPKMLTPLTEGVTPDGQNLNMGVITATVAQYGGYVTLSDMLMLTAIDNSLMEATRLIADQAARTLDTITREVLNGGTNVQYGDGSKSARNALVGGASSGNDYLTVDAVRKAVRFLKVQNAKPVSGNDFVAIIHPDVAYDLMSDPAWVDWQKYTSPEHMYNDEIGKIAGVRFVETTEAKVFTGGGASSRDVYSTLIIGRDAYGVTEISGGGLQHIVKQLGSAGTADPLNQRATVGWKATKVAERLVEQYMIRIETASNFTA